MNPIILATTIFTAAMFLVTLIACSRSAAAAPFAILNGGILAFQFYLLTGGTIS